MEKFITKQTRFSGRLFVLFCVMMTLALTMSPVAFAASPAAVDLGTAGNFAILAKTGISTTGTTSIVGDIGVSPAAASYITGFALIADPSNTFSTSPGIVTGKVYASDYTPPTPTNMTTAVHDMETAYTAAASPAPTATELGDGNITSMTLAPGVYKWGTGVLISAGGVTLSGSANDVWIFQIAQNLTVANSAIVTLSGGAMAKNVFWQVAGKVTLGTTSAMKGTILCQTLIELQTGATLDGRALAQTAVTLQANAVTKTVAAGTHLAFGVQPGNTTAAQTISPAVTVRILDANNNLVTDDVRNVTVAISANPGNGTVSGTTTVAAVGGVATFSGLSINKSGTGYTLNASSNPPQTGATSSAFTINAGPAAKVLVETAANGTGTVALTQNITAGNSITVYAITRDANNNFVGNVAADSWVLASVTGGIVNGDLVQSGDKKSAVFTGHVLGTSEIKATSGSLAATNSGTITITLGAASKLAFGVQPVNTTAGRTITPPVTVRILDTGNNLVTGDTRNVAIAIAANPGSGALSGTKTVSAVGGVATFSGLSIDNAGAGYTLSAVSSPVLTGATSSAFTIISIQATKVLVETAADGSGTVVAAQDITSGMSITVYAIVRDANNDFAGNVAADNWVLSNVTGGIVAGDLVPSADKMSAVFTGHAIGTAEISATSGSLVATNTGTITVSRLQPPSNLIVTDVPDDHGHSLKLTWTASPSEANGLVLYYRMYRSLVSTLSDSIAPMNMFTDIKDVTAWELHSTVLVDSVAAGNTEYTDNAIGLRGVPYYYWIQAVGAGASSAKIAAGISTVAVESNSLPAAYRLGDAYPNPFNPSTTIEYSLPGNARVLLRVYNISGQMVCTLMDGMVSAGNHFAIWDAKGMPSGVYFYSLRAGSGYFETKKVLLLK